jgi:hypothetical protein
MSGGGAAPRSWALEEYTAGVLEAAARTCASGEHHGCAGSLLCHEAWVVQDTALAHDVRARAYDVLIEVRAATGEPSQDWSTAALLRTVYDLVLQPPWESDRLWRSMTVTSALARLGERGILPDAVLRTALADSLRRQMVVHVVGAHQAVVSGAVEFDDLPPTLAGWLFVLEGHASPPTTSISSSRP